MPFLLIVYGLLKAEMNFLSFKHGDMCFLNIHGLLSSDMSATSLERSWSAESRDTLLDIEISCRVYQVLLHVRDKSCLISVFIRPSLTEL